MKNPIIIVVLTILLLIYNTFSFFLTFGTVQQPKLIPFIIITLLLFASLFMFIRKIIFIKRGQVTDDEMTKLITIKASSVSFYISAYYLIVLMNFFSYTSASNILGWSLVGMLVIYFSSWIYYYFFGFKNDK